MRHIILIGFMSAGKSTVGQEVARQLNCNFIDLDAVVVEQKGQTISQIFEQDGEAYFRTLENRLLFEVLQSKTRHVIATGGGIVLQEDNRELMRAKGYVVHLLANEDTIIKRIGQNRDRFLLQGNLDERVQQLMKQRAGMYDFAHASISTDGKLVTQIAARISERVNETARSGSSWM